MDKLGELFDLFVLAIPVATIVWTVTHEELFREAREWLHQRSDSANRLFVRKFFYLFTCEFCLSYYVSSLAVAFTNFRLVQDSWRGAVLAWLALVWVSNLYMSIYARFKLDIRKDRIDIAHKETMIPPEASK